MTQSANIYGPGRLLDFWRRMNVRYVNVKFVSLQVWERRKLRVPVYLLFQLLALYEDVMALNSVGPDLTIGSILNITGRSTAGTLGICKASLGNHEWAEDLLSIICWKASLCCCYSIGHTAVLSHHKEEEQTVVWAHYLFQHCIWVFGLQDSCWGREGLQPSCVLQTND